MKLSARFAVPHLLENFFNRTDVVAIQTSTNGICPAEPESVEEAVLGHILAKKTSSTKFTLFKKSGPVQVTGNFRIGTYCPGPDSLTKFACFDIDGSNHKSGVRNPDRLASILYSHLINLGIPPIAEKSGSGLGWHLWVFFEDPIPARKAKVILHNALYGSDSPQNLRDELYSQNEVEIFPKSTRVRNGGLGSMIWLPCTNHTHRDSNLFFRPARGGKFVPYFPKEFTKTKLDDIPSHLKKRPPRKTPGFAKGKPGDDRMKIWRIKALRKLDLTLIYGDIITGIDWDSEWIECRDPWSPTGDRNPSAAISTGQGKPEPGRFKSHRTGDCISVFDYLKKKYRISFGKALQMVAAYSNTPLPKRKR